MSTEEGEGKARPATCCISHAHLYRTHIFLRTILTSFSVRNKLIFGKCRFNHKLMEYSRPVISVCTSRTDPKLSQPLIGFGLI